MKAMLLIVAVIGSVIANQLPLDLDNMERGDWLVYDNGTPAWYTWGGTYRGVWFNIEDFIPGMGSGPVDQSEFWFYHSGDRPWDTGDVYVEVWNGDAMGPTVQLDQQIITALHYSPVYADYPSGTVVESNFWILVNTELSAGGWPSILGDGAQGSVFHSFYSDDFIVWEPWDIGGACNYFISVDWGNPLNPLTWAELKTAF